MTLNGLNGHFTLNFRYYELPLSNYLLLFYCGVCTRDLALDQKRSAGSGVADRDLQNIWNPRKNCESSIRRRYIVGTLTNKANIVIYYLVHYRLSADSKTHDLE